MTAELLVDNSAWSRLDHPAVAQNRVEEIAGWLEQGRIATCLPFLLEAGYSARNARDHDELLGELMALPNVPIDDRAESRRSKPSASSPGQDTTVCRRSI